MVLVYSISLCIALETTQLTKSTLRGSIHAAWFPGDNSSSYEMMFNS